MRFCIILSMSLEGVGSVCRVPCHAWISVKEAHDWSFCWGSLLTSRPDQSANFKYCSMVCRASCGRPLVVGILAVCFWTTGPVIHMIWGVEVAVTSGKRFTVVCPTVHRVTPYLCRVVSPDHSNSHCSFEMSIQIWCGSWCRTEVPMISSIRLLRIRRCLVAVAKEMP